MKPGKNIYQKHEKKKQQKKIGLKLDIRKQTRTKLKNK